MRRKAEQEGLEGRGRRGAGNGAVIVARHPLHVTLRIARGLPSLRPDVTG
jgi:hypothetical protein